MDWLDACIALRVVGLCWSFSSGEGVKFSQSSSQWEASADTLINVPNPVYQYIAGNLDKVHAAKLLSQRKLAITTRREINFLRFKIIGTPKTLKNRPRPLFRPRTDHACHQKTVPFNIFRWSDLPQKHKNKMSLANQTVTWMLLRAYRASLQLQDDNISTFSPPRFIYLAALIAAPGAALPFVSIRRGVGRPSTFLLQTEGHSYDFCKLVLRIRDILVSIRIRISGSVPLTKGSGSHSFRQ